MNFCKITEGIDKDDEGKIYLTDDNDKGILTNINRLPIIDTYHICNKETKIYSIFGRTDYKDEKDNNTDGTPFIYALKNIYGYEYTSNKENIITYLRRTKDIIYKIKDKLNDDAIQYFDCAILMPSSSNLNLKLFNMIEDIIDIRTFMYSNMIIKESPQVIKKSINKHQLHKKYTNDISYQNNLFKISKLLDDMGDNYQSKKFKKYQNLISTPMVKKNDNYSESDFIMRLFNKDILLIEDTITTGKTLTDMIELLYKECKVNSITVITLLSKRLH